jgi:hypothetical protein
LKINAIVLNTSLNHVLCYPILHSCFVPAAANFGGDNFYCSMVARIEAFEPCDKNAISAKNYFDSLKGLKGNESVLVIFLLVLVGACSIYVAYIRMMPMYRRRHALARHSRILAQEEAEDQVIRVAWGGKAYKDNPDDVGDGNYSDESPVVKNSVLLM